MPETITSAIAARYSAVNSSSMGMPFFLLFNTFSFMESASFYCVAKQLVTICFDIIIISR